MKKGVLFLLALLAIVIYLFFRSPGDYRTIFDYWAKTKPLERPIDSVALKQITENRIVIIEEADHYNISPITIAGIILAEKSMHTGPVNFFEEYYVETAYLDKSVKYLEDLADSTEKDGAKRKLEGESEHEFKYRISHELIWTIGLCQMSIITARHLEPGLAKEENRPVRNIKEVIQSLLTPNESINYCAFQLKLIRDIYLRGANIDIGEKPEILATLYNTGNAVIEVKKYQSSVKSAIPQPNEFGNYILKHQASIENALYKKR